MFREIWEGLGKPPFFLLDLRPVNYMMLVVTNHEVAEQITKASKMFPYSVTKSPSMKALAELVGPESIIMAGVSDPTYST